MDEREPAWVVGQAMLAAFSSHDVDRFGAVFDPELVVVDHRPLSWDVVDLDRFRETFIAVYEVSPDAEWQMVQELGATPTVSYGVIELRGTRDGGPFVTSFLGLIEVKGQLVTHLETFASDDRAAADARFVELAQAAARRRP